MSTHGSSASSVAERTKRYSGTSAQPKEPTLSKNGKRIGRPPGSGTRGNIVAPKLSHDEFGRLLHSSEAFYKRDQRTLAQDVRRGEVGGRNYIVKEASRSDGAQERAVWDIAKATGIQQYFVPSQAIEYNGRSYVVQPQVAGKTIEEAGGGSHAARQALSADDRAKLGIVNYLLGDGDRSQYNTILTSGGGLRQIDWDGALSAGNHTLTPDQYSILFRDGLAPYQGHDAASRSVQRESLSPAVHAWLRDSVLGNPAVSRAANSYLKTQHESGGTPRYWRNDPDRSVAQASFENRMNILRQVAALNSPTFGDLSRIAHEDRWNDIGQRRAEQLHSQYTRTPRASRGKKSS